MAPNDKTTDWHLDKRVPIALILGMIGQVAVVVWGAAIMFKDIEANRLGLSALNGRLSPLEQSVNSQAIQLGRIEENIRAARSDVNRLLNIIERSMQ